MKDITILPDTTIGDAMRALNKTAEKCLLVVDENKKLLGSLTDGDLRRSILNGIKISEDISSSYNTKPTIFLKNKFNEEEAKQCLRDKKIDLIPVVEENNIVVDYVTWFTLGVVDPHQSPSLKVPVVIMAGGKGTRLEPFTKVLPKSLIPVQEKPIIKHIIERFTNVGCNEFYLTLNYKARILKAYFEELQPDYKIHFVEEQEPLGTAGSLCFLNSKLNLPFFITNCDIIIKADYTSLYEFHKKGGYDVTLVASAKEFIIPYGTCELNNDGDLDYINEKPNYNFLINTGLYVLNPEVLKLIPKKVFYHFTDLIKDSINHGMKVGVYPIDDDAWIDVGQWAEYKKVAELL